MATLDKQSAINVGFGSLAESWEVVSGLFEKEEKEDSGKSVKKEQNGAGWWQKILDETKEDRVSLSETIKEEAQKAFQKLGVATRDDFEKIQGKVKRIESKLKKNK